MHNTHNDCWVSLFNKVYDLTKLIHDNHSKAECDPIVLAAGTDITHWFDSKTLAVSVFSYKNYDRISSNKKTPCVFELTVFLISNQIYDFCSLKL